MHIRNSNSGEKQTNRFVSKTTLQGSMSVSPSSRTTPPWVKILESLRSAGNEWKEIVGDGNVFWEGVSKELFSANTIGIRRKFPASIRPASTDQIQSIVRIAQKYKIPLYPISTGRNWGYGSAVPVQDGCVVLDLSRLNKITHFDKELGLITVQPGVTQGMLADYLDKNHLDFLVPTTGAGPDASLLGNALERGYGLTPCADHFAAVTSIKAVLPNGDIYQSALAEAGGLEIDKAFKWGLGPYTDGLFTQGNFGIVTEATIKLAPKPERMEGFFFTVKDDDTLEDAVDAVRNILNQFNSLVGSINLMNDRRSLSMTAPYPKNLCDADGILPDHVIEGMAKRRRMTAWTGAGALYGPAKLVKIARKLIKKALKPYVKDIVFLTVKQAAAAKKFLKKIPFIKNSQLPKLLGALHAGLENMTGRPSTVALPLAYWKRNNLPQNKEKLNPAKDGCGLLWYAPLVPMKASRVRTFVDLVKITCRKYGMEPLITLTSVSSQCFDSTIPLLFNPKDKDETDRVLACLDALYEAGKQEGFLPYRAGIHSMNKVVDPDGIFWQFNKKLKQAIDPENIIAPGRYGVNF